MTSSEKTSKLGQLHRMDLHNVWLSEPQDFTPWLAQESNLKILGDALGIGLELEAQEKKQSRIAFYEQGCDLYDENRWPEYMEWMRVHLERLDAVFRGRIKRLEKSDEDGT